MISIKRHLGSLVGVITGLRELTIEVKLHPGRYGDVGYTLTELPLSENPT
jgi:hypothetical protein